ncbi:hypothetical protein [aff. Roholtiella sp. LEGE 12411]|nr:hypothetical protein [aff. Roholtiella sp. LEGE 12411]
MNIFIRLIVIVLVVSLLAIAIFYGRTYAKYLSNSRTTQRQ